MERTSRVRIEITLAALLTGWMGVSSSAAVEPSPTGPATTAGVVRAVGASPRGPNGAADLARRLREYIHDLKAAGPPAPGCKYG